LAHGTQSKASSIQSEWKTVLSNYMPDTSLTKHKNKSGDDKIKIDMELPLFGTSKDSFMHFLENKSNRDWTTSKVTSDGLQSLLRVLVVIQKSITITYCPMLPYIAALLLTHMPESYAYLCLREMITDAHTYMPTTLVEYYQWNITFAHIVKRMFPETYQELVTVGILSTTTTTATQEDGTDSDGLAPIFQRFFVDLFPLKYVLRIMDIYTICGMETIFRFGIALISLVKARVKGIPSSAEVWWDTIRDYTFSPGKMTDCRRICPYQLIELCHQIYIHITFLISSFLFLQPLNLNHY
jgi:hypothetical protein